MATNAEDLPKNPALTRPAIYNTSYSSNSSSTTQNKDAPTHTTVPINHDIGWRRIIRNFSPSWFSVTMGTGIVSIIFTSIPYQSHPDTLTAPPHSASSWLYYLSLLFFILNIIFFFLASLASILRYTLYPEIWTVMIMDPVSSLFLATIPMGFATLIEGWVFLLCPYWADWAKHVAWGAWMADAVVAFSITAFLSFTLLSSERTGTSLDRITAAQLLPIAATLVAAGTGAEVAEILPDPQHRLNTVLACYVMWGAGMPLALTVIVVYYQRLVVHKLPAREIIVSSFLPLGPLGFGGYGIMYLGHVSLSIPLPLLPTTTTTPSTAPLAPLFGPFLYYFGLLLALLFFSFGLIWLIIALASITKSRPFPFNMGWWGFTFPLGVFACSAMQIGVELENGVFKAVGTAFGVAVVLLWGVVAAGTVRGAWDGRLFFAPCLANLKEVGRRGTVIGRVEV